MYSRTGCQACTVGRRLSGMYSRTEVVRHVQDEGELYLPYCLRHGHSHQLWEQRRDVSKYL